MHKVRTARGDIIDFDEMRVKQSLVSAPTDIQVKARQEYVDQRLKRRSKRRAHLISSKLLQDSADAVEQVVEPTEPVEELQLDPLDVMDNDGEDVDVDQTEPKVRKMRTKGAPTDE